MDKGKLCNNGSILVLTLLILTALSSISLILLVVSSVNSKISSGRIEGEKTHYAAEAGISYANNIIKELIVKDAPASFKKELTRLASKDGQLEGMETNSDDIPFINDMSLGDSKFSIYLQNDPYEGSKNPDDSDGILTIISIGKSSVSISTTIIESIISFFSIPNLSGVITLLGKGSRFIDNSSNERIISGFDKCGYNTSIPIFVVEDKTDFSADLSISIDSNIFTKYTDYIDGPIISIADILNTSKDKINNVYTVNKLNRLINNITGIADIILPDKSKAGDINMGSEEAPKIVVVNGDFDLNTNGRGVLLVKGILSFGGDIDYSGIIIVSGKGKMERYGVGKGEIKGQILIAKIEESGDFGSGLLDISGNGYTNIIYCSNIITNIIRDMPTRIIARRILTNLA